MEEELYVSKKLTLEEQKTILRLCLEQGVSISPLTKKSIEEGEGELNSHQFLYLDCRKNDDYMVSSTSYPEMDLRPISFNKFIRLILLAK